MPQIGVVVDVLADALPGGIQLAVKRFQDGVDRPGDGRGRGVQAVLLHLAHFQQVLDPAQQGLQFADVLGRGGPQGGLFLPHELGDELGIGLVGLGPAQAGLGEGVDPGGVDDADGIALPDEEFGQGQAVSPGCLHADVGFRVPEAGEPPAEGGEAFGVVGEFFVLVLALGAEAGGVEFVFGDVHANGCADGHCFNSSKKG
jgi:hypothetical protein